jgi:hypothetical protein
MADVLQYLLGRRVSTDDTFQLPREKRLADIRGKYSNSGSAIDEAAVLLLRAVALGCFTKEENYKAGGSKQ